MQIATRVRIGNSDSDDRSPDIRDRIETNFLISDGEKRAMKTLRKFQALGLVAMASIGLSSAHATTISGGSFDFAEEVTEISQAGTLNLFDSSLGTLTAVEIEFRGTATTEITLTNKAQQAQRVSAASEINFFFDDGVGGATGVPDPAFVVATLDTGFVTVPSMQTRDFGPEMSSGSWSDTLMDGAALAAFSAPGGGTFDVGCDTISGLNVAGGGGNVDATQDTTAGCGASVSYVYDEAIPMPVPAPIALIGLGLVGLAVRRRFA